MNVTVEIERRESDPAKPEWACPSCRQAARIAEVRATLMVCPHCGFHLRISARERIRQLVDEGTFRELWSSVLTLDPLKFTDLETYPERVREAQAKTGLTEAIVTGTAAIDGTRCVLAVMDFGFMGGSMGSVVGEKLWRSTELAAGEDLPLVAVCSSGGARMQEGILSLMQMAKTSCAVDLINEATSPFVTILADPCTGGVVASFATLADICIAEPGAQLYFTGPRVIAETTREVLPKGFGSAERNLLLGHLDAVVARKDLRVKVGNYLRLLGGGEEPDRFTQAGGRERGKGGMAQTAFERARALAAYARRPFVGGDREAASETQEPAARETSP
jgi:acetyl-CoA carboxylase carboxyl transferase subunit beta